MNDFNGLGQKVRDAGTIGAQRSFLIEAVNAFKFKGKFGEKIPVWIHHINKASSTALLIMAYNIELNKNLAVIK